MDIIKISGKREAFNPRKIERTCIKAGASKTVAQEVAEEVEKQIYSGMPTKKIYRLTLQLLRRKTPAVAERYTLKRAIMELGPAGFLFEKYIAALLKEYGYQAKVHTFVKGTCVTHEIDVIAKKEKSYMIECKYHNELGIYTDLKTVMYTYARFLDVKQFDQGWLICNTNCSNQALAYAECVGLKIMSWSYPQENLAHMIGMKKLYPLTILRNITPSLRNTFFDAEILMVKDLVSMDIKTLQRKTKLSEPLLVKIVTEARKILF